MARSYWHFIDVAKGVASEAETVHRLPPKIEVLAAEEWRCQGFGAERWHFVPPYLGNRHFATMRSVFTKIRCWGAKEHYAELGFMFRYCPYPKLHSWLCGRPISRALQSRRQPCVCT